LFPPKTDIGTLMPPLIWQGYPLLIIGLVGLCKKFHPTGWGITVEGKKDDFEFLINSLITGSKMISQSTVPRRIMGDAADSSTSAIKMTSSSIERGMCWHHMIVRVDLNLSSMLKEKSIDKE
jgi:hypothetical protein